MSAKKIIGTILIIIGIINVPVIIGIPIIVIGVKMRKKAKAMDLVAAGDFSEKQKGDKELKYQPISLSLTYARQNGSPYEVTVTTRRSFKRDGEWYLSATDEGDDTGTVKSYKMSRIRDVDVIDERFEGDDILDLKSFLDSWAKE